MSLLTAVMDHVSDTEVRKLDEEGRAVFSQHAKTFLDGLQTLLNAIRLAKADVPIISIDSEDPVLWTLVLLVFSMCRDLNSKMFDDHFYTKRHSAKMSTL